MRPIKLTMKAFGPYKSIEVVDFTELREKNLFLITGPTGAGKTTLFDAISFAIYGEASGNLRLSDSLRSHFAEDEQLTEVELDFELKGIRYHIHRIPRQLKPKSKGEGLTEQKADAVLTIYNGSPYTVIAGVKPVNEQIERILGINAEQFKQIMMIPQGEFQKLLTASTEEREQVLQKLFDTSLYGSIQNHLESQAKQLFGEIKLNKELRERHIQRLITEDEGLLTLLAKEDKNVPAIIEGVGGQIKADELLCQLLDQQQKEINGASEEVISRREQSREVNEKLTLKAAFIKQIAELNDRLPHIEALKKKVTQAELALQVEPLAEHHNARLMELKEKQGALDQKMRLSLEAKDQLATAEAVFLHEDSADKINERDRLYTELVELRSYSEKMGTIEGQIQCVQSLEAEKATLDLRQEANDTAYSNQIQILSDLQKKCEIAKEAEIQASQMRESLHKKREVHKLSQDLYALSRHLIHLARGIEEKKARIASLEGSRETAEKRYQEKKKTSGINQAAAMAAVLVEGDPCPVCGSAHHPLLAEYTGSPVTEDELNALEGALHQLTEQYQSTLLELKVLESELAQTQKSYESCLQGLYLVGSGYKLESDLGQWIQVQATEMNDLEQTIAQLSALALTYGGLKEAQDKATHDLKQIESQSGEIREAVLSNTVALSSAMALLDNAYQEIPESIRNEQQLREALLEKERQFKISRTAYEEARQKRETCQRTYQTAVSLQEQLTQDVVAAEIYVLRAKEALQLKIEEIGFASEAEFISSRLSSDVLFKYKSEVEDYHHVYHGINSQLLELQRVTEGLTPVDLSVFETELQTLRQKGEACFNERSRVHNRIQSNNENLKAILEINEISESKENTYKLIGHLAKVTKGDNKLGITLERYVLAAFLKDVLRAANLRLNQMTAGRYQLAITEERLRSNAKGGLDLEVFDHYTGRARHVRTLSGGEGFKASLAMALGLADIVQAYAGGVSLDTLFVDEGFGTLDQESLDSAITCLIDLQKSGRLVGIISHVQELKERIDTRLEVFATREGSTTHFTVG